MPAGAILLAPALLAAASALTWGLGLARVRIGRELGSVAAWLGLAALVGVWVIGGRVPLELSPALHIGVGLDLRLDAVSFAFGLVILVPLALQFSFQPRNWQESGVAALAAAAALLAVLSGSLVLTALGLGTAASLVMAQLRQEHPQGSERTWAALMAAWLLLLWAGATLEVLTGTSGYGAVPFGSLQAPVFLLLAGAAVLCSGLVPWRSSLGALWERPRLQAATLALAILPPLGFYVLVRAYAMGAGHWPAPWLNAGLALLGTLTALAAGIRGQAAASRRAYLAEVLPLSGGFSLLALSLGSPLGVAAAISGLLAGGLVTGLLPLLPDGHRAETWLALAVAAGLPPGLVFGARLLAVDATIEAGDVSGMLSLAAAAAWLLGFAGAARALRLPARGGTGFGGSRPGTFLALAAGLAGGVGLGAIHLYLAIPAAAEAVGSPLGPLGGSVLAVTAAAGVWPAVSLAGPLLILGVLLVTASGPAWRRPLGDPEVLPEPLFRLPWTQRGRATWARLRGARLPSEYRSLADPARLDEALARPRPWLWAAIVAVLGFVVTR